MYKGMHNNNNQVKFDPIDTKKKPEKEKEKQDTNNNDYDTSRKLVKGIQKPIKRNII